MAQSAEYFQRPILDTAKTSVANTALDGTGVMELVHRAPPGMGSVIYFVLVQAFGTTTAGIVRLYRENGASGVRTLIGEVAITAITPSTTLVAATGYWTPPTGMLRLPAGDAIYAAPTKAETFNVHVNGVAA